MRQERLNSLHCRDISTEHYQGGSHHSPIFGEIKADIAPVAPHTYSPTAANLEHGLSVQRDISAAALSSSFFMLLVDSGVVGQSTTRRVGIVHNFVSPNPHASRQHLFDNMPTIGIIGGLGPESTVDYYRSILARYRARTQNHGYPQIIINSLDVDKGIAMLEANRLDDLAQYLFDATEQLVRAGADFACIAANTPHLVFDEVQRRSAIPLISIVRATVDRAKALSLRKVGLFGTGFTMRADFYPKEFERAGISLVTPQEAEREYIHGRYLGELLKNQFLPQTRDEILRIARRMKTEDGVEAVVLAGTELPLLLRDSGAADSNFLDTTVIHVEAIVDELLG